MGSYWLSLELSGCYGKIVIKKKAYSLSYKLKCFNAMFCIHTYYYVVIHTHDQACFRGKIKFHLISFHFVKIISSFLSVWQTSNIPQTFPGTWFWMCPRPGLLCLWESKTVAIFRVPTLFGVEIMLKAKETQNQPTNQLNKQKTWQMEHK